jgi:ribosomal protein S18 acetylase RimI-like enzyme
MSEQEYTLEEISYSRKEDCRIMEAVLKNWFQSPKALNFVSPNLSFPFKFKKWVSVSYAEMVEKITTIVLKQDDWIIGHISMKVIEDNAHLFHLFIAPSHRKCGLATKLVNAIENQGKNLGCKTFSLNIVPKNDIAKKLYEKLGYKETQRSESHSIKMEKKA